MEKVGLSIPKIKKNITRFPEYILIGPSLTIESENQSLKV